MNYKKIYDDLILKARSENRKKIKDGIYYENHHIIPTSLGGENIVENKVLLTAKEHFVAHKLLVDIYPENDKMIFALWNMTHCRGNGQGRDYIISSTEYERAKINHSRLMSMRTGENHPNFGKKGKDCKNFGLIRSKEVRSKISRTKLLRAYRREKNLRWGTHPTAETLLKMSLSQKGRPALNKGVSSSLESKLKNSESQKKREKLQCPHCNIIMDPKNVKKYHFDHCLLNPEINIEEEKLRRSSFNVNYTHSEESLDKMKLSWENREILICPHCGLKSKSVTNMNRWHNDNCKSLKLVI